MECAIIIIKMLYHTLGTQFCSTGFKLDTQPLLLQNIRLRSVKLYYNMLLSILENYWFIGLMIFLIFNAPDIFDMGVQKSLFVLTSNVDGLFEKAGFPKSLIHPVEYIFYSSYSLNGHLLENKQYKLSPSVHCMLIANTCV